MLLPIAINFSCGLPYSVLFPSLPGCNSMGDSLEKAIENAIGAATDHIEILLEDGEQIFFDIPNIQDLMTLNEYKDCVWALIDLSVSGL
jgi:predicted RNase H-like HicB family nuclease